MRISGSNAGYTMFRGSVKGTGYPLHSPVSPSLPHYASPCAITFQLESNCTSVSRGVASGVPGNCITSYEMSAERVILVPSVVVTKP